MSDERGLFDDDPEWQEQRRAEAKRQLAKPVSAGVLSAKFLVPPFSVLDARQGYWQKRKRAWLELGIQSEIGRGEKLLRHTDPDLHCYRHLGSARQTLGAKPPNIEAAEPGYYYKKHRAEEKAGRELTREEFLAIRSPEDISVPAWGTSVFDPVLCELIYRWFCPSTGTILDPFAGGSVRGIVAAHLGHHYTGIDLSTEQLEANRAQAETILGDGNHPTWILGDARDAQELAPGECDLIFSCPPYYDLEVYTHDPRDLSCAQTYDDFISAYRQIIMACTSMLKPDRFACFVVGDVRDEEGFFRNLPAHTIVAFESAGAKLYNEAVLLTQIGSLPVRVKKPFGSNRKLGKTHQNVLIFYKGDPSHIRANFPSADEIMPE